MKMIDLLQETFAEYEVGNVIRPLLDGELLSHNVTMATGSDGKEKCAILIRYTKNEIEKNKLLTPPQVWWFERSQINGRWILSYIE